MSASAEAPLGWLVHGKSCPSLQRFGVMNEKRGRLGDRSQVGREPVSPRSAAAGIAPVGEPERDHVLVAPRRSSIIEWK